jgi:hypothetical protein
MTISTSFGVRGANQKNLPFTQPIYIESWSISLSNLFTFKYAIMKISKSLLQAIVVGVTLGTATTSCDLIETITEDDLKKEEPSSRENENGENGTCTPDPSGHDCPGCGMG